MVFKSPLAATISILVYAEYVNVIEIDSNRNMHDQRLEQLVMNTFQLAQVLMKDPFTKGNFAGVYTCDQLSSTEMNKYPKSSVVNTDPMELPGTHWIVIYFNKQMKGEFFDSYGKHPIH